MTARTFSVKLDERQWRDLAEKAEQTGLSKSEVARKLVRISYALLKSGQPYQPQVVGGK